MANDDLATFIDRWTMEYVRFYPHPIERVWRAITDPAELARWFIPPTKWELNGRRCLPDCTTTAFSG